MARRYEVLIAAGAERDLQSIHDYMAESADLDSASRWLDRLVEVTDKLSRSPDRGSHPRELLALGIKEYRQVFFKPWRIVYSVSGTLVIIRMIVDGRRDMRELLARRLLGAP